MSWWNSSIDVAINIRDKLRGKAHLSEVDRVLWLEAEKNVNLIVNESEANTRKEFASYLSYKPDPLLRLE